MQNILKRIQVKGGDGSVRLSPFVYMAAILNATIVGLSFLFTKIALEATSPSDTLGYRFLIAWFLLTIYMKKSKQKFNLQVKDKKTILTLIVLALFYPILFFSFQAWGLKYTTSAECGIILAFSPALTALFAAIFIKEKLNAMQISFIFLSIFGVVYIFLMNGMAIQVSQAKLLGIVFLVISCVSVSGYSVSARFLSVKYTPIQLTYIMITFGMIFFNLYAIGVKMAEGSVLDYFTLFTNVEFILAVIFLGVLSTLLTSFLSNYILSKLSASKSSIFTNLSTIISIAAGAIVLKESIEYYHIIGSMMIIFGVLGTNLYKGKNQKKMGIRKVS
ncbi:DMT family transporter [Bacillus sp. 31A1R]|uniref:DMT family transporter n=1 Tax=Robertmurraya mangrovi TaxID=3098077 RepID=A0ABU5J0G5_9BACI|nr:DMT family transporter [Bacillus sp. 31A1R]MDZ5472871.1 DMT family transporter [Bacillus sp. 31A1R]